METTETRSTTRAILDFQLLDVTNDVTLKKLQYCMKITQLFFSI